MSLKLYRSINDITDNGDLLEQNHLLIDNAGITYLLILVIE